MKLFLLTLLILLGSLSALGAPSVEWKLDSKYADFHAIKPTIINVGDEPIYFNCSIEEDFDADQLGTHLLLKVSADYWLWNYWKCGTIDPKDAKRKRKQEAKNAKLKSKGKYVPSGCRLNPGEEFTFNFSKKNWDNIVIGDGIMYPAYDSGIYRFTLSYEVLDGMAVSNSPEFEVVVK